MPQQYRSQFGNLPGNRRSAESPVVITTYKHGVAIDETTRDAFDAADWLRGWGGPPGVQKTARYDSYA